jgi:hypothetical protein
MTDIERRIRVEQEWARRNVMADILNGQRYEAYNWRRDLRDFDWELGDLNWSIPHWKEPAREINFELDWESLSASSDVSPKRRPSFAWLHSTTLSAFWPVMRRISRKVTHFIDHEL